MCKGEGFWMTHIDEGLIFVKNMKIQFYLKFKRLRKDIYLQYSSLFPSMNTPSDSTSLPQKLREKTL